MTAETNEPIEGNAVDLDPAEQTAAPSPPPEPPLNAVVILRNIDADGNVTTDVATNGNVAATEVQTLIELGLQSWRKKIGLDR